MRVTMAGNTCARTRGSASVSPLRTLSSASRMALAYTSLPAVRSTISMAWRIATPLRVSVLRVRVTRLMATFRPSMPKMGTRSFRESSVYLPEGVFPYTRRNMVSPPAPPIRTAHACHVRSAWLMSMRICVGRGSLPPICSKMPANCGTTKMISPAAIMMIMLNATTG